MEKKSLGVEPYKGVRDFYPEDMSLQKYLFDRMRKTVESFGYVEYGASLLEESELYRAKTGEEIVNEQTYSFKDRGERDVTLRPEMTPTLARMVAARRRELSFPLRWYSIPNLFRYERPQRGRLREHFQLNVDLLGIEGIEAEVEIIELSSRILQDFGLKEDSFEILVNSRKLLDERLKEEGLSPEEIDGFRKLLDKKNKIENFDEEVKKLLGRNVELSNTPDTRIKLLLESLSKRGVTNARFESTLVRGFDYYTDIVFEIFDKNPKNRRALFGGGRYDELLTIFGKEKVPAVGFGMGDVTLRDVLETYNLLPAYHSSVHLSLCILNRESLDFGQEVAETLRREGLNVALDLSTRKVGDQIKAADKQSIPFIACVGQKEKEMGEFEVKELKTGELKTLPISGISSYIKGKLQ